MDLLLYLGEIVSYLLEGVVGHGPVGVHAVDFTTYAHTLVALPAE